MGKPLVREESRKVSPFVSRKPAFVVTNSKFNGLKYANGREGTIVEAVFLRNRNHRIRSHRDLKQACEEAHEAGSTIELVFKNIDNANPDFDNPRIFDKDWTFDGQWDGETSDGQ